MYLHLARAAEMRRRILVRDKVLILAAAISQEMQMPAVAEHCRRKVLAHNPGHLAGRYPTVAEALISEEFAGYVNHLRRAFPLEKVEHMLASLNISWDGERAAYYSDEEYAAALLGTVPDRLDEPLARTLAPGPAGITLDDPVEFSPPNNRAMVVIALAATTALVAGIIWAAVFWR